MKIGFTGTRNGMTKEQKRAFCNLIFSYGSDIELHNGDCVGADDEAHKIFESIRYVENFKTVIHPPIKPDLRAFNKGDEVRKPKSYLARNKDIVDETDLLIATPATSFETQGGTWYTINYAAKRNKLIYIIHPNGAIQEF